MDQLPRLGKRELICLLLLTCNYVVSVWRGFLFLWVLGMGYVILLRHSLSIPYNYFELLQKKRARLESRLTGLSPNILLRFSPMQYGTSDLVHCVACFGVIFVMFSPSMCFYDIGSDGMVTHGKELLIQLPICFLYHVKRK